MALSSASLLVSGSAAAQWSPEIPLTSTNSDIWGEGIATSGTTVHVVYGTSDVLYRRSKDEGATFEPEKALDTGVIHLTDPMVADGNDVWTIYLKNLQSKTDWCCARDLGDIYLLHSGDGGDSWDAPKRLTTAQGAFRVSIAYAANQLHLVWMDFRDNVWDTYYLHSPDRGATWDAEKVIAASAGVFGAERPQVAARGDEVHVTIWDDRGQNPTCMAGPFTFTVCPDTFYTRSLDGGATWGPIVPVAYSGAAFAGRNDIAVSGSSSVIVNFNRDMPGTADANPHMFSVRSADNGVTWDDPVQLTTSDGSSDHGSIIGDSTSVYLAWHDGRSGQLAIYFRGSKTEGATYEPEEKVSTPTDTEASTPLVSLSDNYVHVLWLDKRTGPNQIFTRRRELLMPDPGTGGGGSGGVGGAGIGGDAANGAGGSGMSGGGGGASGGSGGGGGDSGAESGCDCRTTGQSRTADSMMFAALAAVGLGVHRRRVRRARG